MNEMWSSEVERKIRGMETRLNDLLQKAIRLEGASNSGTPVFFPPTDSTIDDILFVRLTDKTISGGSYVYAWRRQIFTASGWADTGESGTTSDIPAIGLNNENRDVGDGKRYPAVFDPSRGRVIFFLTESMRADEEDEYVDPPPAGMYPFGWTSFHVTASYDEEIELEDDRWFLDWISTFNTELASFNNRRIQLFTRTATGFDLSGNSGPFGTSGPLYGGVAGGATTWSSTPAGAHVAGADVTATWNFSKLGFVLSGLNAGGMYSTYFPQTGGIHVGMSGRTWQGGIGVTGTAAFNIVPSLRTTPEGWPFIPYDGWDPFLYFGTSGSLTVDATLYIKVRNNAGVYLYDDEYPATLKYEWSTDFDVIDGGDAAGNKTVFDDTFDGGDRFDSPGEGVTKGYSGGSA